MKNTLITMIFIFFPILTQAQFPVTVGLETNSSPSKAFYVETNGESFCLNTSNGKNVLYHFSENGTNLSTTSIELGGNFQANSMISQDGNAVLWIGGTLQATEQGFKQALIFTVEKSSGNILWRKNVGGERGDELNSFVLHADGNLYFCATTSSMGNGKKDVLMGKLDKLGNILWQKNYGWENDEEGKSILIRTDNSLLIGGNTFSKGAGKSDILLINTDNEGNVLWQRVYGKEGNDDLVTMKENSHDNILLLGNSDEKGMKDGKIYFLEKEGKVIWAKNKGDMGTNTFTDAAFQGEDIVSIGNNTKEGKAYLVNWNNKGESVKSQSQLGVFFYRIANNASFIWGANPAAKALFITKTQEIEKTSGLTVNNSVATIEKTQQQQPEANMSEKLPTIKPNEDITFKKENQLFVCSIGISSFENPEWENPNADVDAKAFFDFWAENPNMAFATVNPYLFVNENAKGLVLKSFLLGMQSEIGENDISLFYLNSQAVYVDSSKEIYFLNYDIKSQTEITKGISLQQISNIFNQIKGKKILMLDIFHKDSPFPKPQEESIFKAISEQFENTKVIFSAAPNETAKHRTESRGGVFVKFLLESASIKADTNNDKILSFSEWIQAFSKEIPNATYDTQHPYSPTEVSTDVPMMGVK